MLLRKKITLIYEYNENWIGGTYYILNIIKALNLLEDSEKPDLNIVGNYNTSFAMIEDLKYPYIQYFHIKLKFTGLRKIINAVGRTYLGYPVLRKKLKIPLISNLYPVPDYVDTSSIARYYFWIPDFQEKYLPQFFSSSDIKLRNNYQKQIVKTSQPLVFSSYNALADFDKFYPENKNKKRVLHFSSCLDKGFEAINIEELKTRYNITKRFYIICNQFWKHKNHSVVLETIKLINDDSCQFVFTGKESDARHPDYFKGIENFVKENNLGGKVLFLGFMDRAEQLRLMQESIAIIQPSLFEGWSTVVEDAKSLSKLIILSDIPLHREQIAKNCVFFDPSNPDSLAKAIVVGESLEMTTGADMNKTVQNFGRNFIALFD